jgi:hypothetical protein
MATVVVPSILDEIFQIPRGYQPTSANLYAMQPTVRDRVT